MTMHELLLRVGTNVHQSLIRETPEGKEFPEITMFIMASREHALLRTESGMKNPTWRGVPVNELPRLPSGMIKVLAVDKARTFRMDKVQRVY